MKALILVLLSIVVAVPAFAEKHGLITDVSISKDGKSTVATFIECNGEKQTVFVKNKVLTNFNVVKFNSTERKELFNQTGNKVSVLIINDAEVVLK